MKITNKMMATAIAFAVGLSTASAGRTTNDWWSVTMESGYTSNGLVRAGNNAGGTWSVKSPAGATLTVTNDASSVVGLASQGLGAAVGGAAPFSYIAKLDTQGDSLTWTPAQQLGDVVLVDADVYLVGSEDAPAISGGAVQTEVYLSTAGTTTNLCAHVGNGSETASVWKTLTGVVIADKSWVRLRIEIDYDATPPEVSFFVNGYKMSDGTAYSWDVMYEGQAANKVNSVSFMGTGYLDNFVGQTVAVTADAPPFTTGSNTNNASGGSGGSYTAVGADGVLATFTNNFAGVGYLKYVKLIQTNGSRVRTARVTVSEDGETQVEFDNLPAGTYSITGFYGEAPTLTDNLPAPAAAAVGANKAASVAAGVLKLTVVPRSGLYYTAFVGTDGGTTGLKAAAASVVATPADEDLGFLQITLPAPTEANGVNLVKIYASDEAFGANADAPTNP